MNKFIRIPLIVAAFVALGLTFGYITFNILSFSRTVEVPKLEGLTLFEANEELTKAGLYLKIEGEDNDPVVQSGRIIRQDVPSGNKVKEKRVIKVVVSKGPRFFSIPLLVNETVPDADAVLIQKGLRIGRKLAVHSDTIEKGRIVAQRPEPDEKITDAISVLVSAGPHELSYFCPDFTNKPLEDARELAKKMGLTVETKGQGGVVSAQKPRAGTRVQGGETIYFEMKEGNADD
ncbi:MAG: PASTA domain-containing protein [Nitrospirae bacterium]|nr:PASTA domain-containing protein [Nitrospirota bacterium]